jgi:UDPglucose 6-dehydrogenase
MKVVMIGTGYVGLVSGTCFAEIGHEVVCVDKDVTKIDRLHKNIMPIYEPGLDALVERNVAAGRLTFTTNVANAMKGADAVFVAVGTPSRKSDGHADLQYVFSAVAEIAEHVGNPVVFVNKSTVPVGTGDDVAAVLAAKLPRKMFAVASNPEFLKEGDAIDDFMNPDRIVIGTEDDWAAQKLAELYKPLSDVGVPILFTRRRTAELIKYAANAFLATKITFINEMADLCEKVGANVLDVAKGIGMDTRIGAKFLQPGPGYGGSCFPKDTLALIRTAQDHETPTLIVEAAVKVNELRKRAMARKVVAAMKGDVRGRKIAVLGLTFKPGTDDMRDSPALTIIEALADRGANITAFDPQGMSEAAHLLTAVTMADDAYSAIRGADATVIITEWKEFRDLDLARIKQEMNGDVLVDLRNIYSPDEAAQTGFTYVSIGR